MRTIVKVLVLVCFVCEQVTGADLFNPDRAVNLVADHRAVHVGDTVTVLVVESATAESSARTRTDREIEVAAEISDTVPLHGAGVGVNGSTNGDATTRRSGKLQAQLSATVSSVDAHGNLVLMGSQKITINGEEQAISISGIVRPSDVSRSNTVLSTRMTNVEIQFTGDGIVSETQQRSLLATVLAWLGLI